MMLPMRISASLASVFCCATAEADASSPTARNDTENRLLIGIFLDCQSEHAFAEGYPFAATFYREISLRRAMQHPVAGTPADASIPPTKSRPQGEEQ